jgi:hypothetical protein
MFIVTLTLEGTDYDHFEWNYNDVDPTAWGTWGPYGATFGQGAEIQTILRTLDNGADSIIKRAFADAAALPSTPSDQPGASRKVSRQQVCSTRPTGQPDDYALFRQIATMVGPEVGETLRVAYCDDRRFGIWIRAFRLLGEQGAVRKAYDEHYFNAPNKVAAYIKTTRDAYAQAGVVATEIDIAMGVDGQTQFSGRANKTKVANAVRSAGANGTPAQRRAAISEAIPTGRRNLKDRCGRDAVFFIDEINTVVGRKISIRFDHAARL